MVQLETCCHVILAHVTRNIFPVTVTHMKRLAGISGCPVPIAGPILVDVTRTQCLLWCMEQKGCLGINFRSNGSKSGQCLAVAPGPETDVDATLPDDPEVGQWQYYPVNT